MSHEFRLLVGSQLSALYEARMTPLPLRTVELLAQFAVNQAMAEFDRARR